MVIDMRFVSSCPLKVDVSEQEQEMKAIQLPPLEHEQIEEL